MAALAPDAGFVRALASRFSDDARSLVDRIEAAVQRADHGEFHELAHALKGASMMAGAIGLRDSAARLERVTASEFGSVGAATLRDLRGTLEATRQALSTIVA
jgi:HPt (histidine-containing phosphotransfer) domain-containing protein